MNVKMKKDEIFGEVILKILQGATVIFGAFIVGIKFKWICFC